MNMIIGQIGTPFNIAVVFHLYLLSTDVCIDVHLYFAYLFQVFPAFRAGVRGFRVPPRRGSVALLRLFVSVAHRGYPSASLK
ncbi:MAG: hypothetical protein A4E41_01518 [Methanoregulaceae archaeon PtaU1.Bin066]|nr:MAG: hypothetical protein A4E41_01518 [Methanoregulaceae archaeon PtaU1.Bin066]